MSVTCLLLVSEKTLLVCWSFFHKHLCRVWVKRKLLKNFKFDYLHSPEVVLRETSYLYNVTHDAGHEEVLAAHCHSDVAFQLALDPHVL